MKLTSIKGVGRATAKKLEEHGYQTVEDLEGVSIDDLTQLGINQKTAKQIIRYTPEDTEAVIKYHIKDANKFRLHAFKQSKDYDPDNLEVAYDQWWKKVLKLHEERNDG